MTLKGIIFDIDGTIANTLPVCIESYRQFLEGRLNRPFTETEITNHFGKSEEGILAHFIQDDLESAVDQYFQLYETLHVDCKDPFPGIREALEGLKRRGIPMGVVTGKGARGAEISLRVLGLKPYFSVIETGSPDAPNKPESLRIAALRMDIASQQLIYVGDTPYDMEAAASVGMHPIGAAWAATSTLTGQEPQARHVFHRIDDFNAWLEVAFEHKGPRLRDNRFAWRFPSTI